MHRFRKLKRYLLLIPILLLVAVVGAILAFNAGVFQSQIEQKVSEATGSKAQLGKVSLLTFPLRIHVERSFLEHPLADVEFDMLSLELGNITPPFDVRLVVSRPKVRMKTTLDKAGQAPAQPAEPAGSAGQPPSISLTLKVEQGEFLSKEVQVKQLDLTFAQRILMRSPANIKMKMLVLSNVVPAPLPVTVETDSLTFSEESVKTDGLKATIAGLIADVKGTSLLKEARHRWLLEVKAPDLSKLPTPPAVVPAKNWKGAINITAELTKTGGQSPWHADGSIEAKGVSAELNAHEAGLTADGGFTLDLKSKFQYTPSGMVIPELSGQLDLTPAKVLYTDLFTKAPQVPLKIKIDAAGDQSRLNLRNLDVQVWDVIAKVNGTATMIAPWESQLKLQIPPVNLTGLERLLPPLRKSPVKGDFAVTADIHGPLNDPQKCRIVVDSLRLNKFSAGAEYTKPGAFSIRGPITADLLGAGELDKGEVKSAKATGFLDLKTAALVMGPLRKDANQDLTAEFGIGNAAGAITIDKLQIRSFFGRFAANGVVTNPLKPKVNVNIVAQPLNMTELRLAMPEFRDKIPTGEARFTLKLQGEMASDKPWNDWPMVVSGDVAVNIPDYKMALAPPTPAAPAAGQTPPATAPSEPFLPPGYLTSNLNLKVAADISLLLKDKLSIRSVSARGQVAQGHYKGEATVGQIFSGSVRAKNLNVPLLEKTPVLQGSVDWMGIVIEDAMAFAKPEYKGMAFGKTSGHADFTTVMPSEKNFLNALKARGDINALPLTLNSVKVGEMINDMLKKIPVLRISPVKVDPLKGQMATKFDLASETMQVNSFEAKDLDGSELNMKGKVLLSSMQVDMMGTFFWVQNQVKGCIAEGNSDAKGRMVVPLAIKGDAMKPSFSILTDVAGKLAGRALECEKNKLVDKVKKQGGEALKKELGKELGKKLEGLFGK